ncbi:MAG: HAMP domain-containing histidine kinase [Dorea sp.]|nr:HAMP domain-containing histidine kinase [Dorea sp.]
MFGQRTLDRLDRMLDEAIAGTFKESDYDESKLSKVESKWKHFLSASALSRENVEKEKDRVKELVSDISHQTKTPMANIRLYTELLKERLEAAQPYAEKDRHENLRLLAEIDRQAEKLGFLIQSLTKMSRLESNIVEVRPKQLYVSELIDTVVQDILPKAGKKNLEVVNTYTGSGMAYYDMKWTKEALGNIVDNAVKYSPCGSRVLLSVTEYKLYTAISVKDFGAGIREEDTAKIFRRFYRTEDVHDEDGVGIGLYLAREIVRRENGYIKVKSKPGQGAEFMMYLSRREF